MSAPDLADLEPADRGRLADALADDYGVPADALAGWFLRTPGDGSKVYATRADPTEVPASAVRVGLRLGDWDGEGFRLSIEGAALLQDHLDPMLDVGDEDAQTWLVGDDVPAPASHEGPYLVLRWEGRGWILGAGPVRDGVVENHLPRGRRIAHPRWGEGGPGSGPDGAPGDAAEPGEPGT